MERSASGSSLRPTSRRRIIADGEIIGTKDWHHPKFEKEWNEWAKIAHLTIEGAAEYSRIKKEAQRPPCGEI